nr:hypothetical protein [Mycobacterium gastri]
MTTWCTPTGARDGRSNRPTPSWWCLAVAQALLGARSEHHGLQMCYGRLGHLLPYLPKQPSYHKRVKAATPLMARPR